MIQPKSAAGKAENCAFSCAETYPTKNMISYGQEAEHM